MKLRPRVSGRPVAPVLAILAIAIPVAAQTGSSPAAGIRDHLHKAAGYLKANDQNSAVKEA
jgi:hypothetical protein